jgi:uncharacterized membrane protein (DUF485 family)
MNTLTTGLVIALFSILFVNVFLFGFLRIPLSTVSLGTLLGIQGVIAGFVLFIYLIGKKKV